MKDYDSRLAGQRASAALCHAEPLSRGRGELIEFRLIESLAPLLPARADYILIESWHR
jgi:hypothetical protein